MTQHHRKIPFTALAILISAAFVLQCGPKDEKPPAGTSRIISRGSIQAVIDVSPTVVHKQMLKMMNIPADKAPPESHVLSVTVMDLKTGKVVSDEKLSIGMTRDGSKVALNSEKISGTGMVHYVAGFNGKPGIVRFDVQLMKSKEEFTASFDLK